MPVYEVKCSNTVLRGEHREYLVEAKNAAGAEKKALEQMDEELVNEPGKNYVTSLRLIGTLVH